jgi:hypothetical protein
MRSALLYFCFFCISIPVVLSSRANTGRIVSPFDDVDTVPPPPKIIGNSEGDTLKGIFQKVEIEASVDAKAWVNHLQIVLLPVIEKAAGKRMPPGTYIVNVKFLVNKDGTIAEAFALNDPGYGLAKGAEKAVLTGPIWSPGIMNGKPVRSYHTQPITFLITKE